MTQSDSSNGKKITGGGMLSQCMGISAGRQNLLSAIWGGKKKNSIQPMPNGDPPSLMLWGVEDDGGGKRFAARHKRVFS